MTEEPSDYRVDVTLDRKLLVKDIDTLVHILGRQRIFRIVRASNSEEAVAKMREHLIQHAVVPLCYVKALNARKLPT